MSAHEGRAGAALTRAALGLAVRRPPVRIIHFGLGAFHRAHQAWYTQHAADADDWGIVAFTGRSPGAARLLDAQGGTYTLVTREADRDRFEHIGSIVSAKPGDDTAALVAAFAAPDSAIVTMTITEAGYRLAADGTPDPADEAVAADVALLRAALLDSAPLQRAHPRTSLGRLILGLEARRRSGGGPLAVVPCDNIPGNGSFVRRGVLALAAACSPALAEWIDANVSFVSTSVDRITPRVRDDDLAVVARATGYDDRSPVVTEPFSDWVLSGAFPAGRPAWHTAGARFVDDIEPFELRKLWLLNGAHTLLAFLGPLRGHETVAEAIGDALCRGFAEQFWNEAVRHLPDGLDLVQYRQALLSRFENPRIAHALRQIADDGVNKLRIRIVPVAERERAADRDARGCAVVIAAWLASEASADDDGAIQRALHRVSTPLAADTEFRRSVAGAMRRLADEPPA